MKMKIPDSKDILRVGMKVRTNGDGSSGTTTEFEGIIGEINDFGSFYVFNDNKSGSGGDINPNTMGFAFAWQVNFSNKDGWVEIIENEKKEYQIPYMVVTKEDIIESYQRNLRLNEVVKVVRNMTDSQMKLLADKMADGLMEEYQSILREAFNSIKQEIMTSKVETPTTAPSDISISTHGLSTDPRYNVVFDEAPFIPEALTVQPTVTSGLIHLDEQMLDQIDPSPITEPMSEPTFNSLDFIFCETCDMFVSLYKYDHSIESAGHLDCKWRYVTKEELMNCIESDKEDELSDAPEGLPPILSSTNTDS